ncbi:MAG TPA: hypothetical protein VM262_05600 [Acidimicrobiales bacterium]|nr:hypothetical protein [Acidimicrobiales bacterium]
MTTAVIIIVVIVAVAFWAGTGSILKKAKTLYADPAFRAARMDELFDGRDQVVTEVTSGTLTVDELLGEANARGYRLVTQTKLDYARTSVVFERSPQS